MVRGVIIFLLLISSLFLFGTVEIWSFAIMQILTAILGFISIAKGLFNRNYYLFYFKGTILFLLLLLILVIQIVPLNKNYAASINPNKLEIINDFNSTFTRVSNSLTLSNYWVKELLDKSIKKFNEEYRKTISITPYRTKLSILKLIAYFIIFISIFHWLTERKYSSALIIMIIVTGFIGAFIGFINNFVDKEKILFMRDASTYPFFAPFYNANSFSAYELLIIPLSLGVIFCILRKGKYFRTSRESRMPLLLIYSFMAIFIILSIFFSLSRSGIIFSIVVLFFVTIMAYKLDRGIYVFIIGVILLILLGILLIWIGFLPVKEEAMTLVQETRGVGSLSTRVDAWINSLNLLKENWLVGTGLGSFIFAFQKDQPLLASRYTRLHNDYLEFFIENGIVPFILLIIIIILYYVKIFRNWRTINSQTQKILIGSGITSISVILMLSIVDFPLQIGAIAFLFIIIAALNLVIGSNYEHNRNGSKYSLFSAIISTVLCVILLIFSVRLLAFDLKRLSFSNMPSLSLAELNEKGIDFYKSNKESAEGYYIAASKRLDACVKEVDLAIDSLKSDRYIVDTGWRLMMKNNLKHVVEDLLHAVVIEPSNTRYWVRLGQAFELIEWVSDLSNPVSFDTLESELSKPVAMAELSQTAEILYLNTINFDPVNIEAYGALAKLYYKHGKLADAIKIYNSSLYIGGQDYLLLHTFEEMYSREKTVTK